MKKPPTTWDQMIDQAEQLGTEGKPDTIQLQANKYEGFTVWFNALDRLRRAADSLGPRDGRPSAEAHGPGARDHGPPGALPRRRHRTSRPPPRTRRGSGSSQGTPRSWSITRSPTAAPRRTRLTSPRRWAPRDTPESCPASRASRRSVGSTSAWAAYSRASGSGVPGGCLHREREERAHGHRARRAAAEQAEPLLQQSRHGRLSGLLGTCQEVDRVGGAAAADPRLPGRVPGDPGRAPAAGPDRPQ